MKNGKVNRYPIFFAGVEWMLSHSVKVVSAPRMNMNRQ